MSRTSLLDRGIVFLFTGVAVVVGMTGCADPRRPYPVKGTIVFDDGQPARELANYLVTFESSELHASSVGVVAEDGTFQLKTLKENDGAIPGSYRVTLRPPLTPEMQGDRRRTRAKGGKELIDRRYGSGETTDLTADVAPHNNAITLHVKRLKQR